MSIRADRALWGAVGKALTLVGKAYGKLIG